MVLLCARIPAETRVVYLDTHTHIFPSAVGFLRAKVKQKDAVSVFLWGQLPSSHIDYLWQSVRSTEGGHKASSLLYLHPVLPLCLGQV